MLHYLFHLDEIYLDMTNINYLHRIANSEKKEQIDGFDYVNEFTFKMDASSSEKIIFYKSDPEKNYTYPIVNEYTNCNSNCRNCRID